MILQLGSLLGGLFSGLGGIARQVLPSAIDIGKTFLQREIQRRVKRSSIQQIGNQFLAQARSPPISVANIGSTRQPITGPVQRSTFVPSRAAPVFSSFGTPTFPAITPAFLPGAAAGFGRAIGPLARRFLPDVLAGAAQGALTPARRLGMPNGALAIGAPGEPRFARDQFGNVLKFIPSPRPGEGFLAVGSAQQLGLKVRGPFYRFNRLTGLFVRLKPRRINPLNFKALRRAQSREDAALREVSKLFTRAKQAARKTVRRKKTKRK